MTAETERPNACKLTECQGKPRCRACLGMDAAYGRASIAVPPESERVALPEQPTPAQPHLTARSEGGDEWLTKAQREFHDLSEPTRRALTGASVSIQVGAHALPYMKHNPDQWLCFQYNNLDEVMAALRSVKAWDSAGYRAKDDAKDASRPSAAGGEAVATPLVWRFTHNRGNGKVAYTFHDTTPENHWLTAYRDTCIEITPLYTHPTAQAGDATNAADGVKGGANGS